MTISPHRQFTGLPPEILTEILVKLDHLSVLRCSLVCYAFHKIIKHSSELLYMIDLYRDGMMDTSFSKLSHMERLGQLRSRRKAWTNLAWKTSSVERVNGICHAYELVGGVFAHGDSGGAEFVTSILPSSTSSGHQLRRHNIQIRPRDFAIDPGQDLVIFIESHGHPVSFEDARVLRLHLRSISTEGVHPKARLHSLPLVVPPNMTYGTFVRGVMLQVVNDIVAVMLYTGRQQLFLYNWRDGTLIFDSAERGYNLDGETEFSFINSRAYLLTCPEENGCIQLYSFESVQGLDPVHVATLHLPQLQPDAQYQSLSSHTGPFETPSLGSTFVTSPTSRIYVLTLSILLEQTQLAIEPSSEIFYLFVKCSTFLSYLKAGTSSSAVLDVPWSLWGPDATRILPGLPSYSSWLRYVHGQRVVLPQKRGSSGTPVIRVLDFNVHRTPDADIHTEPTKIRNCFQGTVVTRLPYLAGTCTLSGPSDEYSAYMIDEERIVAVKAVGDFDEEIQELHVFTF